MRVHIVYDGVSECPENQKPIYKTNVCAAFGLFHRKDIVLYMLCELVIDICENNSTYVYNCKFRCLKARKDVQLEGL